MSKPFAWWSRLQFGRHIDLLPAASRTSAPTASTSPANPVAAARSGSADRLADRLTPVGRATERSAHDPLEFRRDDVVTGACGGFKECSVDDRDLPSPVVDGSNGAQL